MNPKNKQPRVGIVCVCGKNFETTQKRLNEGKGKFCSQACKYKFRKMPKRGKGTYNLVKENPTSFKKGSIPWHKGTKGVYKRDPIYNKKGIHNSPSTEFKKEDVTGEKNFNWKGDKVGYMALHTWVSRNKGKATVCEKCGSNEFVHWANKSHEYKRELDDWLSLCRKCHGKYDSGENWGKATKKFKEIDKKIKTNE